MEYKYNKLAKKLTPLGCYSYDEFKKKSGLSNAEASSIWMDFKLKIIPLNSTSVGN